MLELLGMIIFYLFKNKNISKQKFRGIFFVKKYLQKILIIFEFKFIIKKLKILFIYDKINKVGNNKFLIKIYKERINIMARISTSQNTAPSSKADREKALEAAIAQIDKQFGKGSVMKLGDATQIKVETVSTGSLGLDVALGAGGFPRGRIIEIYGPESSGKTTLALHGVAEVQKAGGIASFIDAEHALDPVYARKLGVNTDELYISQPDSGEQALEIAETMIRSGVVDIVVIDSVAALVPKAELDGDMGDAHVGLQARLMSQALRKLTAIVGKTNCIVIFINQLREKVGVMFGRIL